jgi:uncharacterized protein
LRWCKYNAYTPTTKDLAIMDFDWTNPPFTLDSCLQLEEIESSFDDPFALKLMPDSQRFSVQARFFNLGVSSSGGGVFTVYRTNGKSIRVVHARRFEAEERFLYQRKMDQQLEASS